MQTFESWKKKAIEQEETQFPKRQMSKYLFNVIREKANKNGWEVKVWQEEKSPDSIDLELKLASPDGKITRHVTIPAEIQDHYAMRPILKTIDIIDNYNSEEEKSE